MIKQIYIFGTIATIEFNSAVQEIIMNEITDILYNFDDEMSVFKENSNISKINLLAGKSEVRVSKDFFNIVEKAIQYGNLTNGDIDITSKPVIDIIKLHKGDESEINEKLKLINYKNIILDSEKSTVKLKYDGMAIDLGSLVKGYATDIIVNILNKYSVKDAIIDLGGNVYVKGHDENNEKWNVGIQDPFKEDFKCMGAINLSNKSIVTSGNYVRKNHIISPKTGFILNNDLISVTIISDKSIDGEALSTACFVKGLYESIKLINTFNDIDAIFITNKNEVYCTQRIKNEFNIINNEFHLLKLEEKHEEIR